jgi:hypothetical protein
MRTNRTGCDLVCVGLIVALSFAVIAVGRAVIVLAQTTGTMPQCSMSNVYSTDCPGLGISNMTVTSSAQQQPSCPEGYTLMADLMMKPKCAKDTIEPIYK